MRGLADAFGALQCWPQQTAALFVPLMARRVNINSHGQLTWLQLKQLF